MLKSRWRRALADARLQLQMKPYWKVTLWYMGFGGLWIFLSDKVSAVLAPNIELLTFLQTIKGWCFVLLSGALIFHLTKAAFNQALAKDREGYLIFKKTVEGVYHILLNYLNQMQLVTLEAARSNDFDQDILVIAQDISENALRELKKLDAIDTVTSDHIGSVFAQDLCAGKD